MKKLSCLLLSLVLIISAIGLCACSEKEDTSSEKETSAEKETPSTTVNNNDNKDEEPSSKDNGKVTYKVTVVDDAGNPVVGAMVQCCKEACVPGKTDANGVAEFVLVEDDYDVKFAVFPEGYEYSSDVEVFKFEEGKTELTITIKKVS